MGCNGSTAPPSQETAQEQGSKDAASDKPKSKLVRKMTMSEKDISGHEAGNKKEQRTSGEKRPSLKKGFSFHSETDANQKRSFAEKTFAQENVDHVNPEDEGIYVTCRKGTKPGSPPNQDSWYIRKEPGFAVFGVFDGHGKKGHDVSNFVKRHLPHIIESDQRFRTAEMTKCVAEAFEKMTHMIEKASLKGEINTEKSGTTATIAIHDQEKETLTVAHVGDSGAALTKGAHQKALYLTPDHKPNLPGEMKRIKQSGGVIDFDGYNYRVFKDGEGYPGLNMSRAFGDFLGREAGIISVPDVTTVKLHPGDRYLLLCSDGVWEWLLPQEAFDICTKALLTSANPAKELAFASSNAWVENAEDCIDDITAIFVDLLGTGAGGPVEASVAKKGILRKSKTAESLCPSDTPSTSTPTAMAGDHTHGSAPHLKSILKRSATADSFSDKSSHVSHTSHTSSGTPDKGLHHPLLDPPASAAQPKKSNLKRSGTMEETRSNDTRSNGSDKAHDSARVEVLADATNGSLMRKLEFCPEGLPSSRGPTKPLKTISLFKGGGAYLSLEN